MLREKIILKKRLVLGFCTFILMACGGPDENFNETKKVVKDSAEEQVVKDFDFILPSPLHVASIFKNAGLVYQNGISNDIENISKYTSHLSKQLNLGVYTTDLSYAVLNEQHQEALNYMKVVRTLSDELDMGSIFSTKSLFETFERNMSNGDSVIYVLTTIQEELDDYLKENNKNYLSAVYFAGAWIESMYIGAKVLRLKDDRKLVPRLIEQMMILENLIKGLKLNPDKSTELKSFISDLEEFYSIYQNFEEIRSNDEDLDFQTLTITDKELELFVDNLIQLRNDITKD
jgi:hypothetical protein